MITASYASRSPLPRVTELEWLQGYASPGQLAAGIHTRLYARAYIIADSTDDRPASLDRAFSLLIF